MRLTSKPLAALLFVILFGGIAVTTAFGWWTTTTTKIPLTYTEGEAAGQYNPADIRGSYTFGDVADLFQVPLADLAAAFSLPAGGDPAAFEVKTLEALSEGSGVEIGTASLRLFVAWYRGLPYEPADDTFLPEAAARILTEKAALTPEQVAFLQTHTAGAPASALPETPTETAAAAPAETPLPAAAANPTAQPTPAATEHSPADRQVTGKTTFQDLLDWGVPAERIQQILGAALPNPGVLVKDFCNQNGLSFPTIKTELQNAVNAAP
ncbi:MAG TPA: hypothetical protein PJ988_04065 [Anaerolinea sp.]|nr:hypothetical protein [Anaerolinea sp.]